MSESSPRSCPHCGSANPLDGLFCEHCGKALPDLKPAKPRVVESNGVATTEAGRILQRVQLRRKAGSASKALLAVAIIQTLVALVIFAIASSAVADNPDLHLVPGVFVVLFGIAALFFGLWWWACTNPLPPAIVGLVVYVSFWLVEAFIDPATITRGWIIDLIIIIVLCKAIDAGVQHRRVLRASDEALSPP